MADPRDPINTARQVLATARDLLVNALADAAFKADARDEARRRFAEGTQERADAEQAATDAANDLLAKQGAERDRRNDVRTAITTWLSAATGANDLAKATADVARVPTTVPIVLFPVRIETRFDLTSTPKVLKVRIYPDEIWINQHERALTPDEVEAAKQYFINREITGNEREQWRQILTKMSSERAAYVLRVMQPTFGSGSSGAGDVTVITGSSGLGATGMRFPDDIRLRSDVWTRPAEAVLPDRWLVLATRKGATTAVLSSPIPEPLPVTADPGVPADRMVPVAGDAYQIDDDVLWTIDFTRAESIGMAVRVPLPAGAELTDGTGGFEKLVVVGVKTSLMPINPTAPVNISVPLDTSTLIEQLLDSHHYTRGLALVPQGTPTNNTEGQPTSFPPEDEQGATSFPIERPGPSDRFRAHPNVLSSSQDGFPLATLLGVPDGVMANVAGAQDLQFNKPAAMNRVLWTGTLGYFMEEILRPQQTGQQPAFTTNDYTAMRDYFVTNVRGRGPAPAFRVGSVPYGVLPVVAVANWAKRGTSAPETLEASFMPTLKKMFGAWKEAVPRLLKLGRTAGSTADPLGDLVRVLSTYPSAREVRMRTVTGGVNNANLAQLLVFDITIIQTALQFISLGVLQRLGHADWQPRASQFTYDRGNSLFSTGLILPPDQDTSETAPLSENYLGQLASAPPVDLSSDNTFVSDPFKKTLFYKMVRHSRMVEFARTARAEGKRLNLGTIAEHEVEHFGPLTAGVTVNRPKTLDELLATVIPNSNPQRTMSQHLEDIQNTGGTDLRLAREAMDALGGLPTREYERMFTETLDLCSHRLDGWLTAVATRRLNEMRAAEVAVNASPIGSAIGGYAFVENLRPVQRTIVNQNGVTNVEVVANNGGFIHSPSMTHAAAAAVLRSGNLSYAKQDPTKYAIDLSSERTRTARGLLDEVRAGQPLSAALGYRFERGLHDRAGTIANIDAYRYELRRLYPLVANKSGVPNADPVDFVAARNVVDGLALWNANKAGTVPFATDANLPKATPGGPTFPAYQAIQDELKRLDDLIDAVMDLTTAESVFQIVRGNVPRASATLDALAQGLQPADPEIARSLRSGSGVNHRVPLLIPGDDPPAVPDGWPGPASPLGQAEPFLDGWAGNLLGDPRLVIATVKVRQGTDPTTPTEDVQVSLSGLALSPADVVALARASTEPNRGSLLDRRLGFAAISDDPDLTIAEISYDRVSNVQGARTFPEIMEIARAIGALFADARVLTAEDFAIPAEAPEFHADAEPVRIDAATELLTRDTAATQAFEAVRSALALAVTGLEPNPDDGTAAGAARQALRNAAAFVPASAFAPSNAIGEGLLTAAKATRDEMQRRHDAHDAIVVPDDGGEDRIDAAVARLQAIFGRELRVVPPFHAPAAPELRQSLDGRAVLLGGPGTNQDDNAPLRFLQQASVVRTPLGRWRQVALYAQALGTATPRLDLMQLPFVPAERWTGLPFGDGDPPPPGRVSLLALSTGLDDAPAPEDTWRGLMIDEWVEVIPARTEPTAVGFHYDNPGAEAGQAVLVAVPASTGGNWTLSDLIGAVNDTFDLAKIRLADPEVLDLGQFLPGIYVAQSDQPQHTASTSFGGSLFASIVGAVFGG
jgi:hypothetical protein